MVQGQTIDVLVIDDSVDDADLLIREIKLGGFEPRHDRVDTREGLSAALAKKQWNIIIGDYTMPRFSGNEALAMVRGNGLDTPFIFVSGTIGEDQAVAAMKAGAQDYIIKGQLKRLVPAISRELQDAAVRRERTRANAKLQQLSRAVEQSANLVLVSNVDGIVEYVNPKYLEIMGYSADEVIGRDFSFWMREAEDNGESKLFKTIRAGHDWHGELENLRKDGKPIHALATVSPIKDDAGRITHFISIQEDMTRRHEVEEQLRRAQRMEAIGQLTGGMAHDFNNLLSIIIGNLDLLQEEVGNQPKAKRLIDAALRASLRGGDLTKHLLAFARRQSLKASTFTVNGLVKGMADMLQRTLGEQIDIRMALDDGIWPVLADATQVESACLNLAINARDAMPSGGQLTIETKNVHLDDVYANANAGVTAGEYVMLAVSDTGTGISSDVLERVFEPFFTTKEMGKGTGLGLSMVYGFARQSGGHVKIYSEVGHGTVVRLYLPRSNTGVTVNTPVKAVEPDNIAVTGTILVVEDNAEVRTVVVTQLRGLGYSVIEAEDAASAINFLKAGQPIDLMFTDVVMPGGVTGLDLGRQANEIRSGLPVLYTSGFAEASLRNNAQFTAARDNLLTKPYRLSELAKKVREMILAGRKSVRR
jgi:PAS domain S-box-containing protein